MVVLEGLIPTSIGRHLGTSVWEAGPCASLPTFALGGGQFLTPVPEQSAQSGVVFCAFSPPMVHWFLVPGRRPSYPAPLRWVVCHHCWRWARSLAAYVTIHLRLRLHRSKGPCGLLSTEASGSPRRSGRWPVDHEAIRRPSEMYVVCGRPHRAKSR